MKNMPTRQKALMIVMVLCIGYYVYTFIGEVDTPQGTRRPTVSNQPARPQPRTQQPNPAVQQPVTSQQNTPVQAGVPTAGQSTPDTSDIFANLELTFGRDPFYRDVTAATVTEAETDQLADVLVKGILNNAIVNINGEWLKVSDSVQGFTIAEIHEDYVIFTDQLNKRFIKRLEN